MIILDGSEGEGGGQIIRNAVVYAALLKSSMQIHSIRAKRSKPGLRAQHVKGIELAVDMCGGRLKGVEVGSCELEYHPDEDSHDESLEERKGRELKGERTIVCDVGTAGSICLLLQVALPCWIFNPNSTHDIELKGGTNATMAPQIDYFQEVLLPMLSRNCFYAAKNEGAIPNILDVEINTRGYFPIGKGLVRCSLENTVQQFGGPIKPISLMERGKIIDIQIKCFYAGKVPEFVAKKMAASASKVIKQSGLEELDGIRPSLEIIQHKPAVGSACGIIIVANTSTNCIIGSSALGEKKERAEIVGARASGELLDNIRSGGCVDEWLQDQLIVFMALAHGTSKIKTGCLTQHTQTAIDVAIKLTGAEFKVEKTTTVPDEISYSDKYGDKGCIHGQHIITCTGIGFNSIKAKRRKL